MRVMNWLTPAAPEQRADFRQTEIQRILLVRSLFRMGDSILATPAILLFRKNFPAARIDFVGPRISKTLFRNLPIDHHYEAARSFPKVCWSYLALLKRIRKAKYDLAVDVSGSSAALGSFIVGFSAARFRVGLKGQWDRWFNIRLVRSSPLNKYCRLARVGSFHGTGKPTGLSDIDPVGWGNRGGWPAHPGSHPRRRCSGPRRLRRRTKGSRQALGQRKLPGTGAATARRGDAADRFHWPGRERFTWLLL